jgi:hypothetical protein
MIINVQIEDHDGDHAVSWSLRNGILKFVNFVMMMIAFFQSSRSLSIITIVQFLITMITQSRCAREGQMLLLLLRAIDRATMSGETGGGGSSHPLRAIERANLLRETSEGLGQLLRETGEAQFPPVASDRASEPSEGDKCGPHPAAASERANFLRESSEGLGQLLRETGEAQSPTVASDRASEPAQGGTGDLVPNRCERANLPRQTGEAPFPAVASERANLPRERLSTRHSRNTNK